MDSDYIFEEIKKVSLSMFRKNFLGVYHGSISAKSSISSFLINKREAIFDEIEKDSLISIDLGTDDYRSNISSIDTSLHEEIYQNIPEAKYISYTMPPYATAYTLDNAILNPVDYFGYLGIGTIEVYNPGNFADWLERAPGEIIEFFQKKECSMMLIKGFGLVSYDRDIIQMAKKIALLENSARLLILNR